MQTRDETVTRALHVARVNDRHVLRVVPTTVGSPGAGEASVRVLASSATLSDSVVRRGMSPYLRDLEPPFILGYDFAGRVDAIGADVHDVAVGDLVVDVVRAGANCDRVIRPAASLSKVPAGTDPVSAEIMAVTGMTAYQMLARVGRLSKGETVLVHGASGSVGLLAVEIAKLLGAKRVLGTASAAKLDLVRSRGGEALDRDAPDLGAQIVRAAPGGVDVVLDAVGGAAVAWAGALLAEGGRLVTFGLSGLARGGVEKSTAVVSEVMQAFGLGAEAMGRINAGEGRRVAADYDISTWREHYRDRYDEDLAWLVARVADGTLRPVVVPRALEDASAVHAEIDSGALRGRAVFDHRI